MWLDVIERWNHDSPTMSQKVSCWSISALSKGLSLEFGLRDAVLAFPALSLMFVTLDGSSLYLTVSDTIVIMVPSLVKRQEPSTMVIRFPFGILILTNYAPFWSSLRGSCVSTTELPSPLAVEIYLGDVPEFPSSIEELFPHRWR